jgi:signal transduction histidine kinase
MMIDAAHTYVIDTAPLDVLADKALIKQALRILIDNAIKYTDPGAPSPFRHRQTVHLRG